jgi:methyl-accepting chemotaxis protein
MQVLKNAPIAVKSIVAPCLSSAIIIAIVSLFFSVCMDLRGADKLKKQAGELSTEADELMLDFTRIHAGLYRAISLKSQGVQTSIVAASKVEAVAALDRVTARLRNLRRNPAADHGVLDQIDHAFAGYAEAASQTIDMVEDDAYLAAMGMNAAQEKLQLADKEIKGLVTIALEQRSRADLEADQMLARALYEMGVAATLAICVSLGAAVFFARIVSKPIRTMTSVMVRLAAGDVTVGSLETERRDEVGAMAKAVLVFRDNSVRVRRLAEEQEEMRSKQQRRAERLEEVAEAFDRRAADLLRAVSAGVSELHGMAAKMSSTAKASSRQATAVAVASKQASMDVQTVPSATEQLSISIGEIGRQVEQSSGVAARAVEVAEQTNVSVTALAVAAQKIGQITGLIDDIANKTNLLALNATIEAARAGERGKGFAIVAAEVKALAKQTAAATAEISAQTTSIQEVTCTTVSAINGIGPIVAEMREIATFIAAAVAEQGTATQEIARSIEHIANGAREVSTNITDVTDAALETEAAANQVLDATGDLSRQSTAMRHEIDQFLSEVRAA